MRSCRWLCLLLTLTLGSAATARDLFVNNQTGNNNADGMSATFRNGESGPLKTINRALKLAMKGDRIFIANTGIPYREMLSVQGGHHSGLPRIEFQIIGNGAVLDGRREIAPEKWEFVSENVYRFRPYKMQHQVLYLGDKPADRVPADAASATLPKLAPLQWCLWNRHIYLRTEDGKLPSDYDLSNTFLQVGITMYQVRNVVISDLVVQGFQLDGINAHDGVSASALVGVVCRGNGRSGISVGGASRLTIQNSLVGNNGVAQVRTEGFCQARLIDCDLLENTAPAIVKEGGQVTVTKTREDAEADADQR